MKLTAAHAPRAVWGAPGDPSSPERWAMTWKTGEPDFIGASDPAGTLIVCGLNPSTAWAQGGIGELDPTLTRIHCKALDLGVSDVCMVNLYPQRFTNPENLWGALAYDVAGAQNPDRVASVVTGLGLPEPWTVVAAWGATAPPKRNGQGMCLAYHSTHVQHTARYLRALGGGQLWCWGTTKAGHPRHPLYLPATAKLQPWSAP
jgi:hypothetical protein